MPISITQRALAPILLAGLSPLALTGALHAEEAPQIASNEADETPAVWYFETSDLPVDREFVFGQLENGMRYILRSNATPEGTAVVRMRIDSGSLDETDEERGLSHFLEHMAFNGSNGIPEGEMIALLEREGLSFGADTNASTGFDAITYMLNLPRNDEELLGTALMLMRETASELTIGEDAVDRERGVVLAERRDRRGFAQRAREDSFEFTAPGARFTQRLPIGTLEVLENATAAQLRALYERTYTPSNTVLVIVGDFPLEVMEHEVRARFSDWAAAPAPADPTTGPVDISRTGETDIYLDPALSESVSISVLGPYLDEPDTIEARQRALLRSVGRGIIRRRLARLVRSENAPFRNAGFSEGSLFEDARSNTISIASEDGKWRGGLLVAVQKVREAMVHGFSQAEVNEQLANITTALENRVAGAQTRTHTAYAGAALTLVADDIVPMTPQAQLDLFNGFKDQITPASVLAALQERLLDFSNPLIRFQGRNAPEGGEEALRATYAEALALPIEPPVDSAAATFAYTDFGEPGTVVSDTRDDRLGFRYIRFDNGVRLTLKQTTIREDRVRYEMSVDGGSLMNTREDPLRTYLFGSLPTGGLGQHSADELQTVLAGRSVGLRTAAAPEVFSFAGSTTPRDLTLQMQLLTAGLTDPGYRREGIERFRRGIDNYFETLNSTPGRAYASAYGAILSDNDPRYSLQSRDTFYALDFERLSTAISDRLEHGAIEIALVGDVDEDAAIAAVAASLGALPQRESEFRRREEARIRNFTENRGEHILRHQGEADQALVRLVWPTNDDADLEEAMEVSLLARMVRVELTDRLREELGQAYSPSAASRMSSTYPGYGTFVISASVDVAEVGRARDAIAALIADLRDNPIDPDLIERARAPMLESFDNALKSLGGWMNLADHAQSESDRLERWFLAPDILRAVTAEQLQAAARHYLTPEHAVEFIVLPQEAEQAP